MIDGLPASSVILGMKLEKGGAKLGAYHNRKHSDGKSSSIMGLSALGLESHRESQLELASDNQNAAIESSAEKLLLQSAVSTCNEEDKALEAEMKGMRG